MKSILFALAAVASISLSSCAALTSFIASPLGQASVITAEALGKQLAKAAEASVLQQIIIKASSQIDALNSQGINPDIAKEVLRSSEIAGLQSVYEAAQVQYAASTGARFVVPSAPKNPAIKVSP